MEFWGLTDSGKVRQNNQDVFRTLCDEKLDAALFVVCDGMGGANAGNIASELAADTFVEYMTGFFAQATKPSDASMKMADAVIAANRAVYEKSLSDSEFAGMGTTLVAVLVSPQGEVVANIGDSRLYHITKSKVYQVTKDHSVVEDMIDRGDLTRAEARSHPNKNLITRALGTCQEEEPDVFFLDIYIGDYLLLCSDGLSNMVSESEFLFELQNSASVRKSCENLVELALSRGAPDNVTAIIFKK